MADGRDRDLPELTDLILLLMKRQRQNVPLKRIRELGPKFLDLYVFSGADLRSVDSDAAWRDHLQFFLRRWYLSLDDKARARGGLSEKVGDRDLVERLLSGDSIESVPGYGARKAREVATREATAMALSLLGSMADDGDLPHQREDSVEPNIPRSRRRLLLADAQSAAALDPLALRLGSYVFDGELPPYAPRLRDNELMAAIRDPKRRLTVVVGPPKAGKSRSLLNALQSAEPQAVVWWVNTATGVLEELACALEREVGERRGSPLDDKAPVRFVVLDDLQRCGVNPVNGLNDDVIARLTRHAHVVATLHDEELARWNANGQDRSAQSEHAGGASRQLIEELERATVRLSSTWELDELPGAIETLRQSRRRTVWGEGMLPAGAERLAEFLAAVDQLSAKATLALQLGGYEGALVHATVDATVLYPDGSDRSDLQALAAWHFQRLEPTREWDASGFAQAFHWATTPIGGPGSPHAILQRESRNGSTVWRLLDALTSRLQDEIAWSPLLLVGIELPDEALLSLATILFGRDETEIARGIRQRLAESGNSEAMVELSQQLWWENDAGYAEWHNRSFEAGNGYALNWAGLSWLAEGDMVMATTRLKEAVVAGYSSATEHLAMAEEGPEWRLRGLQRIKRQFDRGLITHDEYLQELARCTFNEQDGRRRPGNFALEALRRFSLDNGAPLDILDLVLTSWKKPLDWADWPREWAFEQLAAISRPAILSDDRREDEPDGLSELLVSFGSAWPLPSQWEWVVTAPSLPPRWCAVASLILQARGESGKAMSVAQEALFSTGCWDVITRLVTFDFAPGWWKESGRIDELLGMLDLTRVLAEGRLAAAVEVAVLAAASNHDEVASEICSRVPSSLSTAQARTCDRHDWHRWADIADVNAWLVILDLLYGAEARAAERLQVVDLTDVGDTLEGFARYLRATRLPVGDRVPVLHTLLETGGSSVAVMASHDLTKLGIKLNQTEVRHFSDHFGREDPRGRVLQRFIDRAERRET